MADFQHDVTVIGAGLAGVECAWQLAERGLAVRLLEQKPLSRSEAHATDALAELVCSNSLRAAQITNAVGLLKEEMRRCGSLVMACADRTAVPAGGALAVDRERFSAAITEALDAHPRITRVAVLVERIPEDGKPVVLATGPLTAAALAAELASIVGTEHLAYYDSVAPIVVADSIDRTLVWEQSRYDKGDAAYLNCPLDEAQYHAFVAALVASEKVVIHACESFVSEANPAERWDPDGSAGRAGRARALPGARYFEGCLPIEVMAERGRDTLAFGPMKPVGLRDPRTGRRPHAVVQLRREDAEGTAYNLVGFQTRMTQPEQRRVFALIPGLEHAAYERFGSVHRNTFVNAPVVLDERLQLRGRPGVWLAGQITGVEGYVESAACGLCVGAMLGESLHGRPSAPPSDATALGALLSHLRRPSDDFQPSNVVWSMFAPIEGVPRRAGRKERRERLAARALAALAEWSVGHRGPAHVEAPPAEAARAEVPAS